MTQTRDQRARESQDSIREVLLRIWDPISARGAGTDDAYNAYIARIHRVLASRPPREAVAEDLRIIEWNWMDYDQVSLDALLPVAEALLALNVRLNR